jgi:NAD(P)-dependent dehydrogenase (short-subunit alcohol dehydrogenase family)
VIADLRGRVALVTGCAGKIGTAICHALAEAEATVIGADISDEPPEWCDLIRSAYRRLDVGSEADWRETIANIDRRHDGLDILVNNAGLVLVKKLDDITLDDWHRLTRVNVDGVFLGTRTAAPLLRKAGARRPFGASVVNMSSVAGIGGGALFSAYCMTKGAVRLFSKACAMEFAATKSAIRVNSVHPGGVQTAMMDHILQRYVEAGLSASIEQGLSATVAAHPLGRLAEAMDIAKAVRFLASDEAGFMTGTELIVDGGFTAH